ncbi:mechanosensitive ion channel family protein [Phyllobacterium endophyticum]|uniref:Mechanosensitive ion channel protein n=1 Tax=Phyllobacterium endophyticum TaxID=1149773 RepID=A0A2P7AVF4_9HYPH|nr:mechanosensitive ion channel domain-containing protein [Phyllobacterium endophyticum]MBB3234756.1 small-conductance mechanosensitive channel [Phyllobacterium endophyticum]PSH58205.1 mechanosensitive ion channel protein [Phyllobacterium endophyticum]TYR38883.1 mechanosensitive ion channel family protein [Phyllobacterium endophyticum]
MIPSFVRQIFLAISTILFVAGTLNPAAAQAPATAQPPVTGIVAEQRPVIDAVKKQIADYAQQLEKADTDAALADLRLNLEATAKKLLEIGVSFRPRVTEINSRLDQLGPPPAQGQPPEAQIVTDERTKLTTEKAEINAVLGETEDQLIAVNKLVDGTVDARRELFANTLSQRVDINYSLGSEIADAYGQELRTMNQVISSWWRFVIAFKWQSMLAAAFFAALAALVLLIGGQRTLGHLYLRDARIESPSYLSRLAVAFWSTLMRSATVVVFLATTYLFMNYFNVLRPDIASLFYMLFSIIGIVYFVHALAQAVICPGAPNWRLVRVAPRPGRILMVLITATATITGLDYIADTINQIAASPLSLTVAKSLFATVLVGLLIIAIALLKPLEDEETGNVKPWPKAMRVFLYLVGLVPIVAALMGYIGLARFVSQQIVINGAVIVTMYLGFLTARAVSDENALAGTKLGRAVQARLGLDETALDQLGLVLSIVINILVVMLGIPIILLLWGFQWSEMSAWFVAIATGFQIGSVNISLVAIAIGLLLFALFFGFTRWFQNWLDNRVMARGRLDSGVRNSIRTAVGYLGLGVAGVIGISAAGINLSSLALVAGGLSLGIGFGMQAIVSNFVSGLILLAERPFKVGDWIETGGVGGIVKKISVRATEVETFQRQSLIIPNSSFINGSVGNWTHRNKLGRVDIPIGVSHKVDPRRVHDILMEIARNHPLVLKNPEPFVAFNAISESVMQFEIRVHLADLSNSGTVQNEIRFTLIDRFAEEGIEIPYPQRDVNLHLEDAESIVEMLTDRVRDKLASEPKKIKH